MQSVLIVQTLLVTGGAAAGVGSLASCRILHEFTSGTCCSSSDGMLAPPFACNTTAACCAACFNDMTCTSWTLESGTTAAASSLCTLQSSCTAERGNCTRGELRRPLQRAEFSSSEFPRDFPQHAQGYGGFPTWPSASEFLVQWRELHKEQTLRWAAGWATRKKSEPLLRGGAASRAKLQSHGHAHDLRVVDEVARAAKIAERAAAQVIEAKSLTSDAKVKSLIA